MFSHCEASEEAFRAAKIKKKRRKEEEAKENMSSKTKKTDKKPYLCSRNGCRHTYKCVCLSLNFKLQTINVKVHNYSTL